ncbi:juvenile hormone esterase-like [Bicyclus anynana]|uniref:Carboxylic ester hydrolase n=1 Tax=Bicyclus anynana TaxID=110368 RepID=A0ABM3LHQ1_BICAN|nr:juvenile hormone esterase-like [Bicyclus anynana]
MAALLIKVIGFIVALEIAIVKQNVGAIIVPVEQGLLEGEQKWTITGDTLYYSFKGMPYAAPPIGNLRFKAPLPALSWKGIRNATEHGNVCPQVDKFSNIYTPGSEDCLFLNIYTPSLNPDSPLSVMFFIHGGSYAYGSGNDDNYGPDFLINSNVVVVTINYRLDALGFLCLDTEEVPGNAGMKDQVAALRWVQRNINNFGGDPNSVTIIGQSAGGASCTLHAMSPMSEGLFHRIIPMSGVAISQFSLEFEPKRRAFVLGKILGFETTNTTALLEYLQNATVDQLLNTNSSVLAIEDYISVPFMSYFVPVVEKYFGQERFLIQSPDDSIKNGEIHDMDILIGHTTAEAVVAISEFESTPTIEICDRYREVLVPRNIIYQSSPKTTLELGNLIKKYYNGAQPLSIKTMPQFVRYGTDVLNFDVIRYAKHQSNFADKNSIYLYQFSCMSERNVYSQQGFKYGIYGVAHFDDLMYVFNANKYNLPVNKNETSYKMIQNTCTLLTNFAKYGNPTPDSKLGVEWPKYNTETEMYLDIGEELVVGTKQLSSMVDFWESIYERADLPF